MTLPSPLRDELQTRLGPIREIGSVSGGCIHPALRIAVRDRDLFLKYGRQTSAGFFSAEAEGLRQLAAAAPGLKVPGVYHHADADIAAGRSFGWIAMEWLEPGPRGEGFSAGLARGLSALHRPAVGGWGWERDGFIGTLPQPNGPADGWAEFWRRRRLEPQLELARGSGSMPATEREWGRLLDGLPELLRAGDEDGPSLLHGDLWGGNILATGDGGPAIVDPAAYRGHREVDLAMSELFGGLEARFYREYELLRPLRPGYREWRRGIYQLYYLLVHVNLFGEAYLARTATTLRSVLAAI